MQEEGVIHPWQRRDTDNFRKLVAHLIPLSAWDRESDEKMTYDKFIKDNILLQWRLMYTEEERARCPCGQRGLENKFFIRNHMTSEVTYVGSTCIERFSEEYAAIAEIAHALYNGFSAMLIEETETCYHFRLTRSNGPLIACNALLESLCGGKSPLYMDKKGRYCVKLKKSDDLLKQPLMYYKTRYNICGTMRINPKHHERMQYVFFSLKKDKMRTKDEEDWKPEAKPLTKRSAVVVVMDDDDEEDEDEDDIIKRQEEEKQARADKRRERENRKRHRKNE